METDNLKLLEFLESTNVSLTKMINSSKEQTDKTIVNTFNTLVEIGCKRRFSYDPLYSRILYKLDNFEKIELVGKVIRPQGQRAPY